MFRSVLRLVCTLGLSVLPANLVWADLVLNETTDFSPALCCPTILPGAIGPGISTIDGSAYHSTGIDLDVFQVSVAPSVMIESIEADISQYVSAGLGSSGRIELFFQNSTPQIFAADGHLSIPFEFERPGLLKFSVFAPFGSTGGGSFDYQLTITASQAIPEPSSFLLVGLVGSCAAAPLVIRRWRKRLARCQAAV